MSQRVDPHSLDSGFQHVDTNGPAEEVIILNVKYVLVLDQRQRGPDRLGPSGMSSREEAPYPGIDYVEARVTCLKVLGIQVDWHALRVRPILSKKREEGLPRVGEGVG